METISGELKISYQLTGTGIEGFRACFMHKCFFCKQSAQQARFNLSFAVRLISSYDFNRKFEGIEGLVE